MALLSKKILLWKITIGIILSKLQWVYLKSSWKDQEQQWIQKLKLKLKLMPPSIWMHLKSKLMKPKAQMIWMLDSHWHKPQPRANPNYMLKINQRPIRNRRREHMLNIFKPRKQNKRSSCFLNRRAKGKILIMISKRKTKNTSFMRPLREHSTYMLLNWRSRKMLSRSKSCLMD